MVWKIVRYLNNHSESLTIFFKNAKINVCIQIHMYVMNVHQVGGIKKYRCICKYYTKNTLHIANIGYTFIFNTVELLCIYNYGSTYSWTENFEINQIADSRISRTYLDGVPLDIPELTKHMARGWWGMKQLKQLFKLFK